MWNGATYAIKGCPKYQLNSQQAPQLWHIQETSFNLSDTVCINDSLYKSIAFCFCLDVFLHKPKSSFLAIETFKDNTVLRVQIEGGLSGPGQLKNSLIKNNKKQICWMIAVSYYNCFPLLHFFISVLKVVTLPSEKHCFVLVF